MAGGAVLRALKAVGAGSRRGHLLGGAGDIDLFVCTQDSSEASRIAQRIFHAVADDQGRVSVMCASGVINIEVEEPEYDYDILYPGDDNILPPARCTLQIVLRIYESPAEVLLGFDVDCCCVGYDGERVWGLHRAFRAIQYGTNIHGLRRRHKNSDW